MELKAKRREKVEIQFFIMCPICDREITGTAAEQVEYNLAVHLENHHYNKLTDIEKAFILKVKERKLKENDK